MVNHLKNTRVYFIGIDLRLPFQGIRFKVFRCIDMFIRRRIIKTGEISNIWLCVTLSKALTKCKTVNLQLCEELSKAL